MLYGLPKTCSCSFYYELPFGVRISKWCVPCMLSDMVLYRVMNNICILFTGIFLLSFFVARSEGQCSSHQFSCLNKKCIPIS
ncbi:hypothetical protein X975_00031, partial [Stegodyphus mimosarum]